MRRPRGPGVEAKGKVTRVAHELKWDWVTEGEEHMGPGAGRNEKAPHRTALDTSPKGRSPPGPPAAAGAHADSPREPGSPLL